MLWSLGLLATGTAVASSSYAGMAGTDVVQQMNPCKGVVKDATGEVVIGASVVVKGSTVGSITGLDGEFEIAGVKKGLSLRFLLWVMSHKKSFGLASRSTLC